MVIIALETNKGFLSYPMITTYPNVKAANDSARMAINVSTLCWGIFQRTEVDRQRQDRRDREFEKKREEEEES